MIVEEHRDTARKFLQDADREFDAGENLQASEKMWGAASHAIMAVAQDRGWSFGRHRVLLEAARRLVDEQDDDALRAGIAAAQLFHSNFYHDHMEEEELEPNAEIIRRYVEKMLALVE